MAATGESWTVWAVLALMAYTLLCSALRHRQRLAMEKKFPFHTRASLTKMTLREAHQIQTWLAEQEFPTVFSASIFFALFKTYGIPSISRLLVATGQLRSNRDGLAASKRAADTSVLLTNMVLGQPGSQRAMEAIARTNFLHRGYRRGGKISDDDMLYTLSLFTLEAMRWTDRFEWRRLTDIERCAMATCWKALGEDLEIHYDRLPSHERGWVDGLQWLVELETWSLQYEKDHMRPADSNAQLAATALGMLHHRLPRSLRGLAGNLAAIILDPRLREALKIPPPPPRYETIFNHIVALRKFLLRHFFLPRPYFLRRKYILESPDPLTGRYHVSRWRMHPWYAKPSWKNRWGPKSWLALVSSGDRPVVGESRFIPEGYLLREVGPQSSVGKGEGEMDETIDLLREKNPGRCPFGLSTKS